MRRGGIGSLSPAKSEPIIDVKIAVEFPTGESLIIDDKVDTGGPSGLKQQTAQRILASDDLGSTHQHPKGAWGSKRLLADVRLYYNAPFLTTHSILSHELFVVICRSSRTGEKIFTLLLASSLSMLFWVLDCTAGKFTQFGSSFGPIQKVEGYTPYSFLWYGK